MSVPLVALHGFLGLPSDWEQFHFSNLISVDLCKLNWTSLEDVAEQINRRFSGNQRPFLMGYSLGGRVALQALLRAPQQWRGGIFISTHPGLRSIEERQQRIVNDEKWALRFEQDEWDAVVHSWNQQQIFQNYSIQREEKDYSREALSTLLRVGSLGRQEDLRSKIKATTVPLYWITGQLDEKFTRIAIEMQTEHAFSKAIAIPGGGHRIPWEKKEAFSETIRSILHNYYIKALK